MKAPMTSAGSGWKTHARTHARVCVCGSNDKRRFGMESAHTHAHTRAAAGRLGLLWEGQLIVPPGHRLPTLLSAVPTSGSR